MIKALVSIVIPAYRPPERLIDLLNQLNAYQTFPLSIIVVDDGSGPAYKNLFNKISSNSNLLLLTHPHNLGKGAALKTAFRYWLKHEAHSQVGLVTADADGQHSVEDIIKLSQALCTEPSALHLGIRKFQNKNIPWRSRFGNQLTKNIYRLINHTYLQDTQTGLRALSQPLIKWMCDEKTNGYEFELAMLLKAGQQKIPIRQHPINTIYIEKNKASHFHPIYDSIKIYWIFVRHLLQSFCKSIPTK